MLFGIRKSSIGKGTIEIWGLDKDDNFIDEDEKERVGGIPLEVWRNPKSTFLDPANGIGNFPVVAFYMLDYQLGKHGPKELKGEENKNKRRNHIVKNMLFMIELNKGNVNTSRKIFEKLAPGVKANICCANTLQMTDEKLKREFGINRFDVVMGNPPYNEGGTKTKGTKGLYVDFIQYSFGILNKNGLLILIHPPNYHRINKDKIDKDPKKSIIVKQIFDNNNLLFLRIIPDTKNYFNVQISVDYYILQKTNNKKKSIILDKNNILTNNVDISIFNTIPNFGFGIINKLSVLKDRVGTFEAKVGRDSSHDQRRIIEGNEYKIMHYINKDGMRIFLSSKPHEFQTTKKVIVNGLGEPYVFNDNKGKYGVSEGPYYVLNPSKKELIFLLSELFQYLSWAFKIQGNKNDMFLFKFIPDLNKLDFTDKESMIKSLGLNDDSFEINEYKVPEFEEKEKIEKPGEGKAPKATTSKKTKGGSQKINKKSIGKTRKLKRL